MIEVNRRERTSPRAAAKREDEWDSTFIIRRSLRFCMLDKESHCCVHCRTGQGNAKQKGLGCRNFLLWTQRSPVRPAFTRVESTIRTTAALFFTVSRYDVVLLDSSDSFLSPDSRLPTREAET